MMSRWADILFLWAACLVLNCGCIRDRYSDCSRHEGRFVRISFQVGDIRSAVKSSGETTGLPKESAVHQIQVWIFNAGTDEMPVSYKEISGTELLRLVDSYGEITLTMEVEKDRLSSGRMLDFYVAANASGAGVVLSPASKPSELDAAVLSRFTPSEAIGTVPSGGLPLSRVVRRVDGSQYLSSVLSAAPPIKIPLVRAVSKISFYMVKPVGLSQATVEEICLDGNNISREEYFFPEPVEFSPSIPHPTMANIRPECGYHSSGIRMLPQAGGLCSHPDPEELKRHETENINDYLTRVHAASIHPAGIIYLKESDRSITGSIHYTMGVSGSQVREIRFQLDPGLFVRNHEWIVYAYFAKDRLYVCPEIAPWTDSGEYAFDWNYTYSISNQTDPADVRILNKDGNDYLKCAWGRGTDGLPYSVRLQLNGQSSIPVNASMLLLLDNADFGFIEDDGGVLSPVQDYLSLPLETTPHSIVFYVVPRKLFDLAGPNPANPEAKLKILLTNSGLSSIRLPFNVINLPGDTRTIHYHYVTPDQYR